jgi:hypothetical protein
MLSRVEGMPANSLAEGVPWDWETFGEYLGKLDGTLGVNAGFMAGHSAIRRVVMGKRAVGEKATPAELERMKALLAQSLAQGAMGFSSTISPTHNDADGNPVPSRHASREELIELARVCRDYEGTSLEFLPAVGRFSQDIKQLMSDLSIAARRPLNWKKRAERRRSGDDGEPAVRIRLCAQQRRRRTRADDSATDHVAHQSVCRVRVRRAHRLGRPVPDVGAGPHHRVERPGAAPFARPERALLRTAAWPRQLGSVDGAFGFPAEEQTPRRSIDRRHRARQGKRHSTQCSIWRSRKVCVPHSCRRPLAATPRCGKSAASCGRTNAR